MKKIIVFLLFCISFSFSLLAQSNCSNPYNVQICPSVYLANQTNSGMLDDAPAFVNYQGEDLVYKITVTNGAMKIFVSFINASAPLHATLISGNCGFGSYTSKNIHAGNSSNVFFVSPMNEFYLWVDGSTTTTFDISIGADTAATYISIPNTRGNLTFDSSGCANQPFNITKPFFQVSYNGVYQTDPMTLSPLNVSGQMCISTYFKNKTGVEGIRKLEFNFDTGYTVVTAPDTVPGFYNPGNWISRNTFNDWVFEFYDSAGTGRGDFEGSPDSCLDYKFCFNILPVSNDPVLTNVSVFVYTDGYGAGYSGYFHQGCCPYIFTNCINNLFSGNNSNGFGYSFVDPGNPLPVQLIEFNAVLKDDAVEINWSTASEINNDYFSIERSSDAQNWETLKNINGAGNSTIMLHYGWIDQNPLSGISYYRLKQTDYDGSISFSEIKAINNKWKNKFFVYPNPASDFLNIESTGSELVEFKLYNVLGSAMITPFSTNLNNIQVNTTTLPVGIYFLKISSMENEQTLIVTRK